MQIHRHLGIRGVYAKFQSLGCLGWLKEREIFVLSHETDKAKIKHNQKEDNWHLAGNSFPDDIWVAGGREIYELFLPKCESVLVSVLNKAYDGNVFLPPFEHHFGRKQVYATMTGFVVYRYFENKILWIGN